MKEALRPFHLALPVTDLVSSEAFYCGLLGCAKGRTATRWIDLDFFGHQVTLHLVDSDDAAAPVNPVDGDSVPARHFGIVLAMADWQSLAARLEGANSNFLILPRVRFKGEVGEQATFFILDPCGNALEFKSFADPTQLFAT
ncbi:MAG: glyoxalase [Woeseiaceae bacterium]|nr:glyoxalase [Woeseiaceae bacterium]